MSDLDTFDQEMLEMAFQNILNIICPNANREGLRDTPKRAAAAWIEWTRGYDEDPFTILKTFEDGAENYDSLVIVHNVPVYSHCEHHLAEIRGVAHIGYLPSRRIVGLSKLARVADIYARRLQVQERLTTQIAKTIWNVLEPRAVGVLIRASHSCMDTRGACAHGTVTTTSALFGELQTDAPLRAEFMTLCNMAERKV